MDLDSLMSKYHATDPEFFDKSLAFNNETMFDRVKREFYGIMEDDGDFSELCDGIYSDDELKFIAAAILASDPS